MPKKDPQVPKEIIDKIKLIPDEEVDIGKIKIDNDNPNVMTEQQRESLTKSIRKFGFTVPIIVDQNYTIADGEQRWTVAKDLGLKRITVKKLQMTDIERRIVRQVMNKLKGSHDELLDAAEFERILKKNELNTLADLIAQDEKTLQEIINRALQGPKDLTDMAESRPDLPVTLTFLVTPIQAEKIEKALEETGIPNKGDALYEICKKFRGAG